MFILQQNNPRPLDEQQARGAAGRRKDHPCTPISNKDSAEKLGFRCDVQPAANKNSVH